MALNPSLESEFSTGSVYYLQPDCSRVVHTNTIEMFIKQLLKFCCTDFLVLVSRQNGLFVAPSTCLKVGKINKEAGSQLRTNTWRAVWAQFWRMEGNPPCQLTGVDWQFRETCYCRETKELLRKLGLQKPDCAAGTGFCLHQIEQEHTYACCWLQFIQWLKIVCCAFVRN